MSDYTFLRKPYAFSVCRIEPENNIHVILEAFADEAVMPMVIVGNWKNSDYGRGLLEKFSGNPNVFLLSPIYNLLKLNKLRSGCHLYIHGHSCGGTNPSLVEAMYLGLPVAAFDVDFNRATTENQALYFKNAEELKSHCRKVADMELQSIGARMKEIAGRRYTWDRISKCYSKLF